MTAADLASVPSPTSAPTAAHRLEGVLNLQRKAAIAAGGAVDHAGRVHVAPMADFDMARTIFGKLEGAIPRTLMKDKLAKDVFWSDAAIAEIETAYAASEAEAPTPAVDQALVDFMVEECDFSMEHADGTFLEHLTFCHDYAAKHYPGHSPSIALLHSILGAATNTFPMEVAKLPMLKERLTEAEALQIEVFPSMLRLLYDQGLLAELEANLHRLDELEALHCHRVIDNAPLVIDADAVWVQLNFHLLHFIDFMPAANWASRLSDPLLHQFRTLSDFLDRAGKRQAKVDVRFPDAPAAPMGETTTFVGRLSSRLPAQLTHKLARKSIRKYSGKVGHSLDYRLEWR